MKYLICAFVLLLGTAGFASAQTAPETQQTQSAWSINAMVGTFAPTLSLIPIADGRNASVELESSTAFAAELAFRLESLIGDWISVYGGMTHIRSRMNHSSALELDGPWRPSSPVNVFTPTGGFFLQRSVGLLIEPRLRLGAGVKFYEFNILEVENGVQDFTGDIGLAFVSSGGPVAFVAEARWMPSAFDPAYLPIRTLSADKPFQNDWTFMLGFGFSL
jgi:hypothetical protein